MTLCNILHARSAPGRLDFELDPLDFLQAVLAQRPVRLKMLTAERP